jgi:hypothetical protein
MEQIDLGIHVTALLPQPVLECILFLITDHRRLLLSSLYLVLLTVAETICWCKFHTALPSLPQQRTSNM